MSERRLEFHQLLVDVLGSRNVYYQPPESIKIKYPAIVYSRDDIQNTFANNNVYAQNTAYNVMVIDPDPDSPIVTQVSKLQTARFLRHFTSDNMNHDSFQIFY